VSRATAVLPVCRSPDDQLPLASADRHHRVDRLEPRLGRFADGAAVDHAWCQALDGGVLAGLDRALSIQRLADRVHHPADHLLAHRHRHDALGALDLVTLPDLRGLAQQDRTDRVLLEVEGHPHHAVGQLEQLAGHAVLKAIDPGDAVTHRQHRAHLGDIHGSGEAGKLLPDDLGDLFGPNLHRLSDPRRVRRGS